MAKTHTGDDLVGATLAQFRIERKLGAGGMGIVYEAADEKLHRRVAIKVLPERFATDTEVRARMLREARSAAAMTHAGIAAVYEVGEADGRVFIAMEYVAGETLRSVLHRESLAVPEALALARGIARALASAHEAGIVHRDLKPENVMVTSRREVKVLDFGLAKLLEECAPEPDELEHAETASLLTEAGRVMGTPGYMSPEQARGQSVDARSDVFSFGVVLYEMLTGHCPFRGESVADAIAAVTRDEPPAVHTINREVDRALARLVDRCLAKKRDDRFSSGVELAAALDDLGGSARPKRPASWWWLLPAGIFALIAGVLVLKTSHRESPLAGPAPAASSSGVPITDAPLPKGASAEAAAVYRAALQAFRDGSMLTAADGFARAAEMDPGFAAAHLRAALYEIANLDESRRSYAAASQNRTMLDERDASLLRLAEIYVLDVTPSFDQIVARAKEAADRYPLDAEVAFNQGEALRWAGHTEEALAAYDRAVELDRQFAMPLWARAVLESDRAQFADALRTVDRCLAVVPTAASCLRVRARVHRMTGECARFEEDAHRLIGIDPTNDTNALFLAQALAAQGKSPKAVGDALAKSASVADKDDRATLEKVNLARLAILEGDLAQVEAIALDVQKSLPNEGVESVRASLTRGLLLVYYEMGEVEKAADVAEAYVEGLPAWTKDAPFTARPLVLAALRRAGRMSPRELDELRTEWLSRPLAGRWDNPGIEWVSFYAEPVATKAEADAALALLDKYGPPPPAYLGDNMTWGEGAVGNAYFHAGRFNDAIPWLQRFSSSCQILLAPIEQMRAHVLLGQALEQKGDTAAACAAYLRALRQWPRPRPKKLVTLEKARERSAELGCEK